MKYLLLIALVFVMVAPVQAAVSFYGWEDGGTILGYYPTGSVPPVYATNVGAPDPVYAGLRSLKLVDNGAGTSETPEPYVAWVTGLVPTNTVTMTVFIYDTTAASPSGRIWARYTDGNDFNVTNGSAGGFATYSGPSGWGSLTYTWTMPAGTHTGLVLEVRTYSLVGDTIWVDDLEVIHPDGSTCTFPPVPSAVEETTWTAVKALFQ